MNHINHLLEMEYKKELEELHANEMQDAALSEARMKELEVQFEVEKTKLAQQELQQKALRARLKKQLAGKIQRKREDAISKLRYTERIPIWNSGGYANSLRGFEMACQTHAEHREKYHKQKKSNGEELLCPACNDCSLCEPVHRLCWDTHLPKRDVAKKLHERMELAQGQLQSQIKRSTGKVAERIYLDATYGISTGPITTVTYADKPVRLCVQTLHPRAYTGDGIVSYPQEAYDAIEAVNGLFFPGEQDRSLISLITEPITLEDVKDTQKVYLRRQLKTYCSTMLDTLVRGAGRATFQYLLENSEYSRHTEKTIANCDLYLDNLAAFYVTAPTEELQQ
jgi:hypothetical protein